MLRLAGFAVQDAYVEQSMSGKSYSYRCSKAAADTAIKSLSIDLAPHGITCTMLHPGCVRTDCTGGNGTMSVGESVGGMIHVLESGVALNGEFYHADGRHLPW